MRAPPKDIRHRRTRAEQVALHAQIILVAQQLFDEGGMEAISMRKIAQRANVSAMGLYRYFPSKAHLMRHIWDDLLQMAHGRALRALDGTADAHARLRAYLDHFMQYWLDNRGHYRVVSAVREAVHETPAGDGAASLRPVPQMLLDSFSRLLEQCCALRRDTPAWRSLVELLLCKVLGFLHAVIGVFSDAWQGVDMLKQRVIDDMVAQVRAAAAAR
jgi:AcrR family transcriptional regulator